MKAFPSISKSYAVQELFYVGDAVSMLVVEYEAGDAGDEPVELQKHSPKQFWS